MGYKSNVNVYMIYMSEVLMNSLEGIKLLLIMLSEKLLSSSIKLLYKIWSERYFCESSLTSITCYITYQYNVRMHTLKHVET